jgi:hypothetical protein
MAPSNQDYEQQQYSGALIVHRFIIAKQTTRRLALGDEVHDPKVMEQLDMLRVTVEPQRQLSGKQLMYAFFMYSLESSLIGSRHSANIFRVLP